MCSPGISPPLLTEKPISPVFRFSVVLVRSNILISLKLLFLPFDANSLSQSKEFEDTNKMFETPSKIDTRVTHFMSDDEIKKLSEEIINV